MTRDYGDVTERPGLGISRIQLERGIHRYQTAAALVQGKDVLEVGCGAGQGLGLLQHRARRVVGGDYSASNLEFARRQYAQRIPLIQLDAEVLPFRAGSFDVILLLEAIYYLPHPVRFMSEARRVLRSPGSLVVSTVNAAWPDFGRSPHSHEYLDANQLRAVLSDAGFAVQIFGAFPTSESPIASLLSLVRRAAFRLDLVPGSLRAKAMLKRVVYGPLLRQPAELDSNVTSSEPLAPISPGVRDMKHSILYAVATHEPG